MKARDKINKLIFEHQNKFGFHSDFDFINEALDEMEQERDEFAKGVVDWIFERYLSASTSDLIEQYKKTLE